MNIDQAVGVEDFNIYSLGAEAISYHLKDIHTLALQVTEGNIGILSLELSVELCYYNDGSPFLEVWVKRGTDDKPEPDRHLTVKVGDWFVILWDEIHLFRDKEFRSTFSFDGLSAPPAEKEVRESFGLDAPETVLVKYNDEIAEKTAWSRLPAGKYVKIIEKTTGRKMVATLEAWDHLADGAKMAFDMDGTDIIEVPDDSTQILPATGDVTS